MRDMAVFCASYRFFVLARYCLYAFSFASPIGSASAFGSTATAEEIRSAYRTLAKQFHPDRNKAPGAQQRFVEASWAYFIRNDAEARGKYDREYLRYFGTDSEREGQPSSRTMA